MEEEEEEKEEEKEEEEEEEEEPNHSDLSDQRVIPPCALCLNSPD